MQNEAAQQLISELIIKQGWEDSFKACRLDDGRLPKKDWDNFREAVMQRLMEHDQVIRDRQLQDYCYRMNKMFGTHFSGIATEAWRSAEKNGTAPVVEHPCILPPGTQGFIRKACNALVPAVEFLMEQTKGLPAAQRKTMEAHLQVLSECESKFKK